MYTKNKSQPGLKEKIWKVTKIHSASSPEDTKIGPWKSIEEKPRGKSVEREREKGGGRENKMKKKEG